MEEEMEWGRRDDERSRWEGMDESDAKAEKGETEKQRWRKTNISNKEEKAEGEKGGENKEEMDEEDVKDDVKWSEAWR